ncbi:VirB2 family type IV secretion system major pilin TrwL [Bartonella taylorii]|uniref:VirB2 family type IV secretion system major pilin TrwL n=1 Tax=Bartonella taylorii TaxID=33046 RepID=A0A9Q8YY68_BARTA|nr:VirB2 family type IV secretion system major pilin TrwL [Bartonella taylorii]USP02375.1 VirB2 family type IV secretion system major pilin TrwL [Bartonella taylorii]
MKQSNNIQSKNNNKVIATIAAMIVFFINNPAYAELQNAKNALKKLKDELDIIIPIAAGVILLCLAIGYAGRYIEKGTFVRWAVGVIIAGSAVQLTTMFFKP